MKKELLSQLKKKTHHLDPLVRVGKSGITDSVVKETGKLLKKKQLIKIKLLKSSLDSADRRGLGAELAQKTGSIIISDVGNTLCLYLPREIKDRQKTKSI